MSFKFKYEGKYSDNGRKNYRPVIASFLLLIFVLGSTIGGTMAYIMTHTESITNTFQLDNITYKLTLEGNKPDGASGELVMPNWLNTETVTTTAAESEKNDLAVTFQTTDAPTLTGHTFGGWYYDEAGTESHSSVDPWTSIEVDFHDSHVTKSADNRTVELTLHAKWTPNNYTIKYNANSGEGIMADTPAIYDQNVTLATNTFEKTGYTFAGWNTEVDGSGTSYEDGATEKNLATEGEVILYAQWTPITYTVVYDKNSEEGVTGSTASSTHTYDEAKNLTNNGYVRTGYTFVGWNTKADGTGTSYGDKESVTNMTSVQNDTVTLYAQWGAKSYVIRYHANGGEGTMADQTIKYDVPTALNEVAFTMHDYSFGGWSLTPNGEKYKNDKETVVNLAESGVVDLYAIWLQNPHIVTFDYNGGSGSVDEINVLAGKEYGPLPEYPVYPTEPIEGTKEVMTRLFTGWYTEKTGGTRVYPETIVNRTDDHILYAHWEDAPSNNVIQNMVVKNNPDDNKDGVVDDLYLEFTCTSSFEKYNIPLNNLVPGQAYKLTYTASNDASFGDYPSGYKNSVYASYIMADKELTGGRIDDATNPKTHYGKDILATWESRVEDGTTNDKNIVIAINDELLNGPWKDREITFTAVNSTMYWTWDFGLIEDHIQNNYNMTDIKLEPIIPKIEFANKKLILHETSKAKILNDSSSDYATNFVFDGDGYAETMYFPITGLTAGTTYTITLDHRFEGSLINSSSYNYGFGIMNNKPEVYGSSMDSLKNTEKNIIWISDKFVMPTVTNQTQSVTLTFTATGNTAYWVWNMANCSDSNNCTIDIKVTNFSASHKNGGTIIYHTAPSSANFSLRPVIDIELPEDVVMGEEQTIYFMPDAAALMESATIEGMELCGWIFATEFGSELVAVEDFEFMLEMLYDGIEEEFAVTIAPVYKQIKQPLTPEFILENVTAGESVFEIGTDYSVALTPDEGFEMSEISVEIDGETYNVYIAEEMIEDESTEEVIETEIEVVADENAVEPYFDGEILVVPASLITEETESLVIYAKAVEAVVIPPIVPPLAEPENISSIEGVTATIVDGVLTFDVEEGAELPETIVITINGVEYEINTDISEDEPPVEGEDPETDVPNEGETEEKPVLEFKDGAVDITGILGETEDVTITVTGKPTEDEAVPPAETPDMIPGEGEEGGQPDGTESPVEGGDVTPPENPDVVPGEGEEGGQPDSTEPPENPDVITGEDGQQNGTDIPGEGENATESEQPAETTPVNPGETNDVVIPEDEDETDDADSGADDANDVTVPPKKEDEDSGNDDSTDGDEAIEE